MLRFKYRDQNYSIKWLAWAIEVKCISIIKKPNARLSSLIHRQWYTCTSCYIFRYDQDFYSHPLIGFRSLFFQTVQHAHFVHKMFRYLFFITLVSFRLIIKSYLSSRLYWKRVYTRIWTTCLWVYNIRQNPANMCLSLDFFLVSSECR